MRHKVYIAVLFLNGLICFSSGIFAQARLSMVKKDLGLVSGRVISADSIPAPFVTVSIEGTKLGCFTNPDGTFNLELGPGKYNLVIQSVTYHRKEYQISIHAGSTLKLNDILLIENSSQLNEIVVTGQYGPQSIKNSVFRVRTVGFEQIRAKGALEVKDILNSEIGVRFTNDLTTGESDIELMGMSGQNVKILLDGIPLVDRGSTRQSISQLDVNNIERIELVEGPLSVTYGTDALAGVINIITRKNKISTKPEILLNFKVQEETVGKEYQLFQGEGLHNEHLGVTFTNPKGWNAGMSFTRNNFGGWQGTETGRSKNWNPKDQWYTSGNLGYRKNKNNTWYRLDYLKEVIYNPGDVNTSTGVATDQDYITNRFTHQLQSEWSFSPVFTSNFMASFQDYTRKTQTTTYNTLTGDRRLTLDEADQDVSVFQSLFFRNTTQFKINEVFILQPGMEFKRDEASGQRIQGNPVISDFSMFFSSEIKPAEILNIRPGLRFSKNSTYDAPPVIPSLSIKLGLSDDYDIRLSYARGFRAPALRELYFWFFNSSHSIQGNPDLKAEYSNSLTGSFTCRMIQNEKASLSLGLSGFYNSFNNMITTALSSENTGIYTYVNIDSYKTTGGTLDLSFKNEFVSFTMGGSWIGRYNKYSEGNDLPAFVWSPEINSAIIYKVKKYKMSLSLYCKYTGEKPQYETIEDTEGHAIIYESRIGDFQWMDFGISKELVKGLSLNSGVKNIFNITTLDNTSLSSGAHSTGGPQPLSYGRSYYLGISFQFSK